MSTLFVDTINEKTTNNGVYIPGHVLQAVTGTNGGTSISTTSTSLLVSGLKVTITPSSTSSKIYVVASFTVQNGTTNGTQVQLYRKIGSGSASAILYHGASGLQQYSAAGNNVSVGNYSYLDSPSTTSAVEYEIYYSAYSAGTSYFFSNGQIIAMEIGA